MNEKCSILQSCIRSEAHKLAVLYCFLPKSQQRKGKNLIMLFVLNKNQSGVEKRLYTSQSHSLINVLCLSTCAFP